MPNQFIRRAGALLLLGLAAAGCGAQNALTAAPTAGSPANQAAAPTAAPTMADVAPTIAASPTIAFDPTPTVNMAASPAVGGAIVPATIKTFLFKPAPLEVKVGTQVTWTNEDDIEHSVTSGTPEAPTIGLFDSGFFVKGQSFSHAFNEPGEFPYFCMRHNSMTGLVIVTQ